MITFKAMMLCWQFIKLSNFSVRMSFFICSIMALSKSSFYSFDSSYLVLSKEAVKVLMSRSPAYARTSSATPRTLG